jgi:hypothetical protein
VKQTNGSMPRGSQVCELLGAYQAVLDTVGDLPLVPMVLWRHEGRNGLGRLHYLPRPRWLLRYFVVRHVDRTLASLSRRYSARAALGSAVDSEQRDREAVREFQQSLPPTRPKTYLTVLIVATIVLGWPIVDKIAHYARNLTELDEKHIRHLGEIFEKIRAVLTPNLTSVNDALSALVNGGLEEIILVTLALALSLYVVLRPFVPAFRLKRMLLNLAPEPQGRHRSAAARWSVPQATGVYERERALFEEFGGRAPREFPFDLVVPALIMLAPLSWGGLFIGFGFIEPVEYRAPDVGVGALVLILALLRLAWLYQTWRRRQSDRHDLYMPFEVRIHRGRAVAKVEAPLFVGARALLVLWFFLFFSTLATLALKSTLWAAILPAFLVGFNWSLLVSLPWWYRVNRELRDLDHSYGTRKSGRQPVLSLLMMTVGWLGLLPPFISVFKTGRCIQEAQARAGQPATVRSPWMLALGLLLPPLLFAYLQHELNKVWAIEGEPLDPWPAGVPSEYEVHRQPAMAPGLAGQTTELAGG